MKTNRLALSEARLWCGQHGGELMIDTMGRISLRHPGEGEFTAHSIETITETMADVVGVDQMDMGVVLTSRLRNEKAAELWARLQKIRDLGSMIEGELLALAGVTADAPTNDNAELRAVKNG
ncbi:hypothetical protein [Terasakiella sp.]|uniref:hypothetical protein n=1 Tax=Terasakiella sp. TaxID=2034861 RepID=UPI003AA8DC4E